jgi:glycine/sarcosine N-methyltransferase
MLYDDFSHDYDRFVDWPGRLAYEMPFLQAQLKAAGVRRILDAACGTGQHAIALAQTGFEVAGADVSAGMIARARANAQVAQVPARFEQAGFGELEMTFGKGQFDAVLCLGNSLPHALSAEQVTAALADFAACLKPGGLVIIQNRNFDAVMTGHQRWMEPQSAREDGVEWLFLRFYDFEADGTLTFNILTLKREGQGAWSQSAWRTSLRPLLAEELQVALTRVGFTAAMFYGDMQSMPFEAGTSGNLIACARLE